MTGRPSDFAQETADRICQRIANGESLRAICEAEDMPGKATVLRWLAKEEHEDFRDQYARAREMQADTIFDEILDIADDGSNDWMRRNGGDDAPGWAENGEALNRSRIRIDARKWMAGKLRPKKYGERLALDGEVTHKADETITGLLSRIASQGTRLAAPTEEE